MVVPRIESINKKKSSGPGGLILEDFKTFHGSAMERKRPVWTMETSDSLQSERVIPSRSSD